MYTCTPTECSNQEKKCCENSHIFSGKWLQIFLSFVVSLTVMADGLAVGWTAFTIADIIENNNNKTVTLEQASLIGTIPAYASLIPLPFVMYSAGKIGRKWTILWGSFFTLICWTLLSIVSSDHLTVIYIAVICRGISNSVHYPITQIYSAETAQANIRGILGTFIPVLMNTGILLSYICTIYISIEQLALVGVAVISVHFLLFITAPKTPYFWILKNKPQKAKIALQLLRAQDYNIAEELNDIKETAEQNLEKINLLDLLKNLYNLKLLLIVSLLQLFQQLTGIDAVLMFLQVILGSSNELVSNSTSSILLSVAKTVSCIVALVFMEKLGRRILLISSSVSTAVTLTALGVYFYVKDALDVDVSHLSWMPTMLLILFIVSYNLGFGSVIFVLGIEMLPTRLRAFGSMLIQIIYAIGMAVTTNIFAWLKDTYGFYAAFWFLAINTFVGLLFIYYFIVETKGKSLKQIQDDNK